VLGLAQTGTGKTAAFALPILERIIARGPRPKYAPRAAPAPTSLIVAPTRELASQIHAELQRLGKYTPLVSTVIFGGVGQAPQVRALSQHPDVVVACPGRLLDLIEQGCLTLSSVETLVLDEADHMFDMGFLPSIRRIVAKLPKRRQNLFFSATMPRELRKLADDLLNNPAVVELAHSRPPETIEHGVYAVQEAEKLPLLQRLFAEDGFRSAIVFLRTKHRAKKLAQQLERLGHRAVALQGNLSQSQREKAMGGFRAGTYDVLVATDIAARGIDVAAVSHVVNFDLPMTAEAYTHRIGRTGRSELTGRAYSFATPQDREMVRAIEKLLGAPLPRAALPPGAVEGKLERAVLETDGRSDGRDGGRRGQGRGRTQGRGREGGRDAGRDAAKSAPGAQTRSASGSGRAAAGSGRTASSTTRTASSAGRVAPAAKAAAASTRATRSAGRAASGAPQRSRDSGPGFGAGV